MKTPKMFHLLQVCLASVLEIFTPVAVAELGNTLPWAPSIPLGTRVNGPPQL